MSKKSPEVVTVPFSKPYLEPQSDAGLPYDSNFLRIRSWLRRDMKLDGHNSR